MLKQFAPNASIPPSPNNTAWISSATETAIHAASGPNSRAIRVPPTACPVVPPGRGTLNIIPRNEKAAPTPIKGSFSFGSSFITFLSACTHTGIIAAVMTAQTDGDR